MYDINGIYIVLFLKPDRKNYNWGLFVSHTMDGETGTQYHVRADRSNQFLYERIPDVSLPACLPATVALRVGSTTTLDSLEITLETVPIRSESSDPTILFNSRTWVKDALDYLTQMDIIECEDLNAVELEAFSLAWRHNHRGGSGTPPIVLDSKHCNLDNN